MWGYIKINDSYRVCDKCSAVVFDVEVHNLFHQRMRDETSIYELGLPVRVLNAILKWDVTTVEGLIFTMKNFPMWKGTALEWLYDLRGVGFKSVEQATGVLQEAGIIDTSGNLVKD